MFPIESGGTFNLFQLLPSRVAQDLAHCLNCKTKSSEGYTLRVIKGDCLVWAGTARRGLSGHHVVPAFRCSVSTVSVSVEEHLKEQLQTPLIRVALNILRPHQGKQKWTKHEPAILERLFLIACVACGWGLGGTGETGSSLVWFLAVTSMAVTGSPEQSTEQGQRAASHTLRPLTTAGRLGRTDKLLVILTSALTLDKGETRR